MSTLLRCLGNTVQRVRLLSARTSRLVYVKLITLLVGLLWLLTTTTAAQRLAKRATAEVDRLEIEVTGGSLWNGLEIHDFRRRDEGTEIGVRQSALRWDPYAGYNVASVWI